MKNNRGRLWRWSALAINIAAIIFIFVFPGNVSAVSPIVAKTMLFIPARYGLISWFAIILCFLVYNVYALLPSQRHYRFYDGIAMVVILYLLLAIIWINGLTDDKPGLQVMINILLLLTALLASKTVKVVVQEKDQPPVLFIPFILNLGWVSALVILNAVSWFRLFPFS